MALSRPSLGERWLLVGILFVAALFRFWNLPSVPPGINNDIGYNGIDALGVLNGDLRLFFPGNFGREPLMIYLQAAGTALLGQNALALRFPATAVGLVTVAAMAAMTRTVLATRPDSRRVAILAAAILAISPWHVFYGRVGWRATLLPFALVFAAYALFRAYHGKSGWAWAGGWFAIAFYTYLAARLAPIFPALLFVSDRLVDPAGWRERRGGWACLAVVAVLVTLPLAGYFALNPDQFASRLGQLSPFADQSNDLLVTGGDSPDRAVLGTLAMFTGDGGESYQLYVTGRGVFDVLLMPFFFAGLALAARRWRDPGNRFLLFWLVVLLLPAIIARDRHPSYTRAIGVIPPAMAFAALGLSAALSLAGRRVPPRALAMAVVVLLAISTAIGWRDYFDRWANDPETARAFAVPVNAIAAEANRADVHDRQFILLTHPGRPEAFSLMSFAYLYTGVNGRTVRTDAASLDAGLRLDRLRPGQSVWLYDFPPTRLGPDDPFEMADYLLRRVASREREVQDAGRRRREYVAVGSPRPLNVTGVADVGPLVRLTAVDLTADRRAIALAATVTFDALDNAPDRLSFRLTDGLGNAIGQADRPISDDRGRPPERWERSRGWPVYAVVDLPGGLPPGPLVLDVAAYPVESPAASRSARLAVLPITETVPVTAADLIGSTALTGGPVSAVQLGAPTLRVAEERQVIAYWTALDAGTVRLRIGDGPPGPAVSVPAGDGMRRLLLNASAPVRPAVDAPVRLIAPSGVYTLGTVTVLDRDRDFGPVAPSSVVTGQFGDRVRLAGYDAEIVAGTPSSLDLTLYWQAIADDLPDLDVFVHVLDGGRIVAQRDGRPDAPTAGWRAGEYILDGYTIPLPAGLASFTLDIGLVDRATGVRLPTVTGDSVRTPAIRAIP